MCKGQCKVTQPLFCFAVLCVNQHHVRFYNVRLMKTCANFTRTIFSVELVVKLKARPFVKILSGRGRQRE